MTTFSYGQRSEHVFFDASRPWSLALGGNVGHDPLFDLAPLQYQLSFRMNEGKLVSCRHLPVLTTRLAEPLQDEPRRLLGNANLFGELERGDSLASGDDQIHRVNPFVKWNVRTLEDRSGADGEVEFAHIAAVIAVLAFLDTLDALALWTLHAIWPEATFKIDSRRFCIRKCGEELKHTDRGSFKFKTAFPKSIQPFLNGLENGGYIRRNH